MPPVASIHRKADAGNERSGRSRTNLTWTHGLMLKIFSVLLAHGVAVLTLVISMRVWHAWRSPDQSIEPWPVLALAGLLCLHPFAALGVSAVLASPSDAISIARSLAPRSALRWLKHSIRLVRSYV